MTSNRLSEVSFKLNPRCLPQNYKELSQQDRMDILTDIALFTHMITLLIVQGMDENNSTLVGEAVDRYCFQQVPRILKQIPEPEKERMRAYYPEILKDYNPSFLINRQECMEKFDEEVMSGKFDAQIKSALVGHERIIAPTNIKALPNNYKLLPKNKRIKIMIQLACFGILFPGKIAQQLGITPESECVTQEQVDDWIKKVYNETPKAFKLFKYKQLEEFKKIVFNEVFKNEQKKISSLIEECKRADDSYMKRNITVE